MADTKVEKGQSLSSIAKKYGLSVQDLLAANPNIKDPNKISTGMKLSIPEKTQAVQQAIPKNAVVNPADKYLKDASGKTIMGPNNAPILNKNYESKIADARQAQLIKEYNPAAGETVQQYADRMGIDSNTILEQNKGKGLSLGQPIPRGTNIALPQGFQLPSQQVTQAAQPEGPGIWDTIKSAVGGVADKSKEFLGEYGGLVGGAAQGLAAYKGYEAGKEARGQYQDILAQQLAETQATDKALQGIKYDPARYAQQQEFLQQRIAGGGLTPVEQQIQRQGDLRSAKMLAAARLSGIDTQARMGGGVSGAGSAYAASIAGQQALANELANTQLQREASASQRLESDVAKRAGLSTQQTQEEADLAARQAAQGLARAQAAGTVRGTMGENLMAGAASEANLYGRLADLAQAGIAKVAPPPKTDLEKAQEAALLAQANYYKDYYSGANQPAEQPPQQDLSNKAGAAQSLGSTGKKTGVTPTQQKPPQTPTQQFNETYAPKPGQPGYGVLASSGQNPMQNWSNAVKNVVPQMPAGEGVYAQPINVVNKSVKTVADIVKPAVPAPVQSMIPKATSQVQTAGQNIAAQGTQAVQKKAEEVKNKLQSYIPKNPKLF